MSRDFEELDFCETPLGELILRRRRMLSLGGLEVDEVKLGVRKRKHFVLQRFVLQRFVLQR